MPLRFEFTPRLDAVELNDALDVVKTRALNAGDSSMCQLVTLAICSISDKNKDMRSYDRHFVCSMVSKEEDRPGEGVGHSVGLTQVRRGEGWSDKYNLTVAFPPVQGCHLSLPLETGDRPI